jgi:malate dehydrogenase (oxaloacetate-decarboxylating)(NADP+)
VPDDVAAAYQGAAALRPQLHHPGAVRSAPDLVIPVAVAKAAMESGVARKPIVDMAAYKARALGPPRPDRLDAQRIYERVRRQPKRVVFAEGEEEQVMRAAVSYANQRLGTAILLGREDVINATPSAPASISTSGHGDRQRPLSRRNEHLYRLSLRAAAAQRLSCSATASA